MRSSDRTTASRVALARRRSRARRDSAGAAMFIVAITLGLLAAMGLYGLSATAADIRAAGHLREATQGQSAGEHGLMSTAELLNPTTAAFLVSQMTAGAGPNSGQDTTGCRTANPFTGITQYRDAEACLRLDLPKMQTIANANGTNLWPGTPFSPTSFGPGAVNLPYTKVELTNPVDVLSPDGKSTFKRVTVTVFVEMKPGAALPAETVVAGRGSLTVGPVGVNTSGGRIARY